MKLKFIKVILFFSVLIIIPVLIFSLPKEEISYDENRRLADMPSFSFSSYLNKDFADGFEKFLSDRFILRKQFIILKNGTDKLLGKNEIDSTFNFKGQLVGLFRRDDDSVSDGNCEIINGFGKNNGNVYFVLIPTVQEMLKDKLPLYLNLSDESEFINHCYSNTKNVKTVNVVPELRKHKNGYLYYRTDHHHTSEGALISYNEIAKTMGLTVFEKSDFDIEKATSDFPGTLYSKTFDVTVKPDEIYFYKGKGYENITVSDGTDVNNTVYFREYLSQKDKYVSFAGENKGMLTVKNPQKNGKLLLIKDSYANTMLQYFSLDYGEITVLDLRYTSIGELKKINPSEYDGILILYSVSSYYTDTNISKLEFIKGK